MAGIADHIIDECLKNKDKNPVRIFNSIASKGIVKMHGPEHHILDGACLLTAYKNAGGNIDLEDALEWMALQGTKMPGAACAHWGVCGATTSIGAALSYLDRTGPLSTDGSWGRHMLVTSKAIAEIGMINGPRCCKRDAYVSLSNAVEHINKTYDVKLEMDKIKCSFSAMNQQCIKEKCPFHGSIE